MANEKFTPEPWRRSAGSLEVTTSKRGILEGDKRICIINETVASGDYEANAALIAAAPAMYQKLTHLAIVLESLERSLRLGTLRPIIEDTEKLLAAARGEEQTTTNKV